MWKGSTPKLTLEEDFWKGSTPKSNLGRGSIPKSKVPLQNSNVERFHSKINLGGDFWKGPTPKSNLEVRLLERLCSKNKLRERFHSKIQGSLQNSNVERFHSKINLGGGLLERFHSKIKLRSKTFGKAPLQKQT